MPLRASASSCYRCSEGPRFVVAEANIDVPTRKQREETREKHGGRHRARPAQFLSGRAAVPGDRTMARRRRVFTVRGRRGRRPSPIRAGIIAVPGDRIATVSSIASIVGATPCGCPVYPQGQPGGSSSSMTQTSPYAHSRRPRAGTGACPYGCWFSIREAVGATPCGCPVSAHGERFPFGRASGRFDFAQSRA